MLGFDTKDGRIESEARSACNTLSPLTYQPITEVNMANTSLPNFQPLSKHRSFVDLTGRTFIHLRVLGYVGSIARYCSWLCECACGELTVARSSQLLNSSKKSCGCLSHGKINNRVFGECLSAELITYHSAKGRCQNPNNRSYRNYGGRGIEFRFASYEAFLAHVGRKPSPKHTLDRIDNSGHYEPGNVRWATLTEQANNKRNSTLLTFDGHTQNVTAWSAEWGIPRTTLRRWLRQGLSVENIKKAYDEKRAAGEI